MTDFNSTNAAGAPNLKDLKRAAASATPGPWRFRESNGDCMVEAQGEPCRIKIKFHPPSRQKPPSWRFSVGQGSQSIILAWWLTSMLVLHLKINPHPFPMNE